VHTDKAALSNVSNADRKRAIIDVQGQMVLTRTQFDQNRHCERSMAISLGTEPSLRAQRGNLVGARIVAASTVLPRRSSQ